MSGSFKSIDQLINEESRDINASEPSQDDITKAVKSVSQLNGFKIGHIRIYETGVVYLYDDNKLISKWPTVKEFMDSCQ